MTVVGAATEKQLSWWCLDNVDSKFIEIERSILLPYWLETDWFSQVYWLCSVYGIIIQTFILLKPRYSVKSI